MITFAVLATILTLTAILFALSCFLREKREEFNVVRNELNLTVMRDQLHELNNDLTTGVLSHETFSSSKRDLEQRLIEEMQPDEKQTVTSDRSRWVIVAIGLFIPLVAVSLYLFLGNSGALDPSHLVANDASQEVSEQQIIQMVNGLAEKLKTKPDNVEGWNMLARSYNALGRYSDALMAYEHLIKIEPKNADYLVSYADTLAVIQNRNLQGEPEKLIKRALELDPQNLRGLSLAGSAAFDRHEYADAIAYWKEVLNLVQPDTDMARNTLSSIGEAQSLLGESAQPVKVVPREKSDR